MSQTPTVASPGDTSEGNSLQELVIPAPGAPGRVPGGGLGRARCPGPGQAVILEGLVPWVGMWGPQGHDP